jgi:histidyl-tRNA synthetase
VLRGSRSRWPRGCAIAGLDVILHCGGGSFKTQFKRADASGAEFAAVVLGEDEVRAGQATVKWLREPAGAPGEGRQQRVALEALGSVITDALVAGDDAI